MFVIVDLISDRKRTGDKNPESVGGRTNEYP